MDEDFLRELFALVPGFRIRRMFGGQGIYAGDRILALVVDGELYLKSDAETDAIYEADGLQNWHYARTDRSPVRMPYYRMPDGAFDDPDEAQRWIALADGASRRAAQAKGAAKPKGEPKRPRSGTRTPNA
ncbi:MAG: TfoX/Sxy family protein [Aurantimonas coralicida]